MLRHIFELPLIRSLVRDIDLTRFTRSMALLLTSGIPISSALELTKDVVVQPQVRDVIVRWIQGDHARRKTLSGNRTRGKLFPSILKKMIEVGERSGSPISRCKTLQTFWIIKRVRK